MSGYHTNMLLRSVSISSLRNIKPVEWRVHHNARHLLLQVHFAFINEMRPSNCFKSWSRVIIFQYLIDACWDLKHIINNASESDKSLTFMSKLDLRKSAVGERLSIVVSTLACHLKGPWYEPNCFQKIKTGRKSWIDSKYWDKMLIYDINGS